MYPKREANRRRELILAGLSLALIGNASGKQSSGRQKYIRGVFDKETRRKPLAFAADALSYGI
jgi:hypothetical protein